MRTRLLYPLTTIRAMAVELSPLIETVPFYGPPIVLFGLPWILFALLLVGPFALLLTLVIAMLAAWLVVIGLFEVARLPFRLVGHVRSARAHAPVDHAKPLAVPESLSIAKA